MKRAGDEGGLFLCFTYDSLRMRYGLLMDRRGAWKERASEEGAAIAFSALPWPTSSLAPGCSAPGGRWAISAPLSGAIESINALMHVLS